MTLVTQQTREEEAGKRANRLVLVVTKNPIDPTTHQGGDPLKDESEVEIDSAVVERLKSWCYV